GHLGPLPAVAGGGVRGLAKLRRDCQRLVIGLLGIVESAGVAEEDAEVVQVPRELPAPRGLAACNGDETLLNFDGHAVGRFLLGPAARQLRRQRPQLITGLTEVLLGLGVARRAGGELLADLERLAERALGFAYAAGLLEQHAQ